MSLQLLAFIADICTDLDYIENVLFKDLLHEFLLLLLLLRRGILLMASHECLTRTSCDVTLKTEAVASLEE